MGLSWWIKYTWVRRLIQGNTSRSEKTRIQSRSCCWRQRRASCRWTSSRRPRPLFLLPGFASLFPTSTVGVIHFSKIFFFFYLILIQVQGNKRTRIYLTGHGNETVKVYFLDPLFSRTRTCKWIQKVVLQKRSRMYYYCRNGTGSRRHLTSPPPPTRPPKSCTELTRQRSLFVLFFFNPLL